MSANRKGDSVAIGGGGSDSIMLVSLRQLAVNPPLLHQTRRSGAGRPRPGRWSVTADPEPLR